MLPFNFYQSQEMFKFANNILRVRGMFEKVRTKTKDTFCSSVDVTGITHTFQTQRILYFRIHDTFTCSTHHLSCRHHSSNVHRTFELDTMGIDDYTEPLGTDHTLEYARLLLRSERESLCIFIK